MDNNKDDNTIGKFISGGLLWWILGIVMSFFYNIFNKVDKNEKNWRTRISGFVLCLIIGALIDLICYIIPTIFKLYTYSNSSAYINDFAII